MRQMNLFLFLDFENLVTVSRTPSCDGVAADAKEVPLVRSRLRSEYARAPPMTPRRMAQHGKLRATDRFFDASHVFGLLLWFWSRGLYFFYFCLGLGLTDCMHFCLFWAHVGSHLSGKWGHFCRVMISDVSPLQKAPALSFGSRPRGLYFCLGLGLADCISVWVSASWITFLFWFRARGLYFCFGALGSCGLFVSSVLLLALS